MYDESNRKSAPLEEVKFIGKKGDTSADGRLILTDIRLAKSPHKKVLEALLGNIGDDEDFYAIYLEGKTNPDGANQSVRGYSVHVLRRISDPNRFTFRDNTIDILAKANVYFFEKREFGKMNANGLLTDQVKVFAKPKPISDFVSIREGLRETVYGEQAPDGTCTDRDCAHTVTSKHTRKLPLS
ncbi:MAG: hypothetical protein LH606_10470 [Cytophagaceae bacterium]|nr:hypothetical protein [Cytophagaceae bacterium]